MKDILNEQKRQNNHGKYVRDVQQVLTFSVLVLAFQCPSCWNSADLTEC